MANECVGLAVCPVCKEDGAQIREGVKGSRYLVCDNCCSQIRTMSRLGRKNLDAITRPLGVAVKPSSHKGEAAPAPVPAAAQASLPPPVKEKGSWFSPPKL